MRALTSSWGTETIHLPRRCRYGKPFLILWAKICKIIWSIHRNIQYLLCLRGNISWHDRGKVTEFHFFTSVGTLSDHSIFFYRKPITFAFDAVVCARDRMMSVTFSSSKQAATAMSAISEIRADLVVESLKPPDTIGTLQHFSSVSRTFVFCRMCILLSLGQLCEHCDADIPFNILRLYVLQLFINYLLIPVLWQCWFCDRRSICPIKKISHRQSQKTFLCRPSDFPRNFLTID